MNYALTRKCNCCRRPTLHTTSLKPPTYKLCVLWSNVLEIVMIYSFEICYELPTFTYAHCNFTAYLSRKFTAQNIFPSATNIWPQDSTSINAFKACNNWKRFPKYDRNILFQEYEVITISGLFHINVYAINKWHFNIHFCIPLLQVWDTTSFTNLVVTQTHTQNITSSPM